MCEEWHWLVGGAVTLCWGSEDTMSITYLWYKSYRGGIGFGWTRFQTMPYIPFLSARGLLLSVDSFRWILEKEALACDWFAEEATNLRKRCAQELTSSRGFSSFCLSGLFAFLKGQGPFGNFIICFFPIGLSKSELSLFPIEISSRTSWLMVFRQQGGQKIECKWP